MEFIEKIEEYLAGTLSEEEKQAFENELENNSQLKEAFSKLFLAIEAIKIAGIRKQVKTAHNLYHIENESIINTEPKIKKSWVTYISKIAASIAVFILGVGTYQFISISAQKVVAENSIPYIDPTMRSENSKETSIAKSYKSGNYNQVIELSENGKTSSANDRFLVSMAYYNVKKYEPALQNINKQLNNAETSINYQQALQYYKGLTLLGIGKTDEAITIFKIIKTDTQNPYSKNINEIFMLKLRLLALKK